jgi:hypothetical protein
VATLASAAGVVPAALLLRCQACTRALRSSRGVWPKWAR